MFILWKGFQSFSDVGQCMYTYVYTCMCYVRTTYVFAKRREETRRNARKQEKTSGNARKCKETDSVTKKLYSNLTTKRPGRQGVRHRYHLVSQNMWK